jgi:hypothetical protein
VFFYFLLLLEYLFLVKREQNINLWIIYTNDITGKPIQMIYLEGSARPPAVAGDPAGGTNQSLDTPRSEEGGPLAPAWAAKSVFEDRI